MNQTPQRPGNEPEPLDAAEREIARMLRNLPSGSPPPELDARILAAARRAVQQPRARQLNWWRSVGFGTAASALIAIGLFVRMHGADQGVPPAAAPEAATDAEANRANSAPAAAPTPKPVPEPTMPLPMHDVVPPPPPTPESPAAAPIVTDTETVADKPAANAFPAQQKAQDLAPPPPAAPMAQAPQVAREAAPAPAPASAAPPPADERAASKSEGYVGRRDAMGAAAAAAAPDQGKLDKDAQPAANMAASSAAATGGAANADGQPISQVVPEEQDAKKSKSLDSITVTRSRLKHVDAKPAAPATMALDDDALLAPGQWLERIRQRIRAGDEARARESLKRFQIRYPDTAVPDDLQPLLR